MGRHQATKKTLAQVQQELLKTLWISANSNVNPPEKLPDPVGEQDLENVLLAASTQAFNSFYHYDFDGAITNPPNTSGGTPYAGTKFCSITDDEGNQIENYVKDQILNPSPIKDNWIYDDACATITAEGKALFAMPTGTSWTVEDFGGVYDSLNSTQNSYQLDAVMMYCNANLTIDGNTAQYTFLYFLGVFYEITSPKKAALNSLIGVLANSANDLLTSVGKNPKPLSSPPNIDNIKEILDDFCSYQFETQNGFAFKKDLTTPPDMVPNTQAYGVTAPYLFPAAMKSTKRLESFVNTAIMSAMEMKDNRDVEASASNALVSTLHGLFGTATGNNWSQIPFNGQYSSANLTENSYQTNTILSYTNASLTQQNVTVNVSLVYYMGVYYQVQSPYTVAQQGVLKQLCVNADALLNTPISIYLPYQECLSKILHNYALGQFQSSFGFAYKGNASVPPLAVPGINILSNALLGYFLNNDLTNLRTLVDDELTSNINVIPKGVRDAARSDLYNELAGLASLAQANIWTPIEYSNMYSAYIGGGNNVETTALIVYSNATGSYNGVPYTATFFYYLGLYYVASNQW